MIKVQKFNERGRFVWEYIGTVLERSDTMTCIEAFFGREAVDIGLINFKKGDRMVEWFYSDRYFNVFKVEEGTSGTLKGWYCNITRPAHITEDLIASEDLALDVVVTPDGEIVLLDEDDFEALDLDDDERQKALDAVDTIRGWVAAQEGPFEALAHAS